jgi:hypothetical protein
MTGTNGKDGNDGAVTRTKGSGLTRTSPTVTTLAAHLERARQTRNERITRADTDYVESVRRAIAALNPETGGGTDEEQQQPPPTPPVETPPDNVSV